MQRFLWMTFGSVLTLLGCAIGWFFADGWHTNELVLINYLQDGRKVAIYDDTGRTILSPTNENYVVIRYDMLPGEGGPVVVVDGMPPQLGGYVFPCDGERHVVVVRKNGDANPFGIREGNELEDLRRKARCLVN